MQNLKPKKHLGQHFLRDENIARRIVTSLDANPDETVIEIGPGMGVLTKYLVEKYADFGVVEFDPAAVEYLGEAFEGLKIHHFDFLKWNPAEHLAGPAHFIGNLPYNVSSPIFFHFLENLDWIKSGVFMVQKEVAKRITTGPGSKEYGILSVLLGAYFDLKYLFSVSDKVFQPRPKVQSAVFLMAKKPDLPDIEFKQLAKVVKAGFGQRRKILRNALKSLDFTSDLPADILDARAEQLEIETFISIAKQLSTPSHDSK